MTFAPLIRTVPILPMTANERERSNRWDLAKEKNDWTLLIPLCAEKNQQKEGEMRVVQIMFCKKRGPRSDDDNLHFRCKSILDALVRRRWMIDDSPKYIILKVAETTNARATQTIIAVTDPQALEAAA
jgi:hypothetical protein